MSTQPLTSPESQRTLQFTDGADCKRWIEKLPLTNIQQAQRLSDSARSHLVDGVSLLA